jgi:hypothetical protein
MPRLGIVKENLIYSCEASKGDLVLALHNRKLKQKDVQHTRLCMISRSSLWSIADIKWSAIGLSSTPEPGRTLIAISSNGEVFTYSGQSKGAERIDGARDLRACRRINDQVYACGMDRQVYVRHSDNQWQAMHAPNGNGEEVCGFEAIDGFNHRDIYAVGWQGEIWHFDGQHWSDLDSPLNVILTGVCCAGDGYVYACGQEGALLQGRGGQWDILFTEGLSDDLWDVRWAMGKLYVASMSALYELQGDRLAVVDFGKAAPDSCYKLADSGGILWSIGQENIFSFDGKKWERWD